MLTYFVLGALAAFGLFCALWLILGAMLPCWQGCMLLCLCGKEKDLESCLFCYRFLHGIGIVKAPLLIPAASLSEDARQRILEKHKNIEFCTLEELETEP